MFQSIEQALSGFSIVLATIGMATILLALTGLFVAAVIMGAIWASSIIRQIPTRAKLPTVLKEAKKEKPVILRDVKKAVGK